MRRFRCSSLLLAVLLLPACLGKSGNGSDDTADATVLFVGPNNTGMVDGSPDHPYLQIRDALSAAPIGSIINLAPGSYRENLTLNASVSLVGESAVTTIVEGDFTQPVITINGPNAIVELRGLTVRAGFSFEAGAILATGADLTVRDCIIRDSGTGDVGGQPERFTAGGLHLIDGNYLVERCLLTNLSSNGIGSNDPGKIVIRNTVITACEQSGVNSPGSEFSTNPDIIVENVTIFGTGDQGIHVGPFGDVQATNVIFAENGARSVFESQSAGDPHLFFCFITDNYRDVDLDLVFQTGAEVDALTPPGVNTGNLDGDPLFVDEAAGDFQLAAGSPCINSGDPSLLDPDSSRSDMGAFGGPEGDWDITFSSLNLSSMVLYPGTEEEGRRLLDDEPHHALEARSHEVDWNRDGRLDRLSIRGPRRQLYLHLQSRRGSWYPALLPANLHGVLRCTTFDLDGDMSPDLLVETDQGIVQYLNQNELGGAISVRARPADVVEVDFSGTGDFAAQDVLRRIAGLRGDRHCGSLLIGVGRQPEVAVRVLRNHQEIIRWDSVEPGQTCSLQGLLNE